MEQNQQFDFDKLQMVFKRSLPVLIMLLIFSVATAYLTIRYTKDLYQSESVLQLDIKSEAQVLGFRSFDEDINNLSKEIELLKSKLFFTRVAEVINNDVNVFAYGKVLFEERYQNSPFFVEYKIEPQYFDHPFDVDILNSKKFILRLKKGDQVIENTYSFGEEIVCDGFVFMLALSPHYRKDNDNVHYFFKINSPQSNIRYLMDNTEVKPLDFKAKTISVTFKDFNKYKAQDILMAIDTLYIYYTQLEKNRVNDQKIKFLNEQLHQTESTLSELENYFENFTIDNRTTDMNVSLSRTITMLEELDSIKMKLNDQLDNFNEIYDKLLDTADLQLGNSELRMLSSEVAQDINRLEELKKEMNILKGAYKTNTFAYRKKKEEINFLRERIIGYVEESRKGIYDKLDEINLKKNRLETDFSSLPSKSTEYAKTERYYDLYEEFYLSLMKNKAQFELAQAGTVTDFKILSSASLPSNPIAPNKILIWAGAIIASVILSFLFIIIRYLLHNSVSSEKDIEHITPTSILGSIPFVEKLKGRDSDRLVIDKVPKSEISEAFRSIRTNLEFIKRTDKNTVIAITSTVSGEGKTFVTVNLGGVISLLKSKVVLVDLDMRKPRLQKVFYHNIQAKGVSTILIEKHSVEECILKTNLENLDYISSGPIPPNPSELIHTGSFDKMIGDLKSKYDVVIIDTPPVGLVTDGILALKKSDIALFVVRSGFSKKSFIQNIDRLVKAHHLDQSSIIFNANRSSKNYGYGSYGKSYGYYEEPEYLESNLFATFKSLFSK
ncbi:MAG TPA: tyrosine protein kinase [Cytophagales bacterium]|jgi:tyrosine-protein kinase Etk/Wzc|nr:tyrosine protein kinase [Cytophagales bacterium]